MAATFPVADEAALARFAAQLAAILPPHAFVALHGDLGAGKTTFVKCMAAAMGIDPAEVVSPTFGLIHEYHPLGLGDESTGCQPPRIVHADMYRLTSVDELAETGWDDAIAGDCHVFVEWPERIAAALPADRIDLAIGIDSPSTRTVTLTARGPIHARVVAGLGQP
jgi:tRNA threonylcarbamoyl adenosine modification protein YjeE